MLLASLAMQAQVTGLYISDPQVRDHQTLLLHEDGTYRYSKLTDHGYDRTRGKYVTVGNMVILTSFVPDSYETVKGIPGYNEMFSGNGQNVSQMRYWTWQEHMHTIAAISDEDSKPLRHVTYYEFVLPRQ